MVQINIDLTSEFDRIHAAAKEANKPKKRKKAKKKDSVSEDLSMRLMAVGGATDEVATQLEIDTVDYVKDCLASGKKKQAVNFLNENKHRFTPDMKDSLTEVINNGL